MRTIALVGNPNSGKTTVFNALTGLRHKIGNYPGVTVERKEGRMVFEDQTQAIVLDLPGTYSLTAHSPDERITTDLLLGRLPGERIPDLVVSIIDASTIERGLYLVSQLIDRHLPLVIVLNMLDVARSGGMEIDAPALQRELGVPVVPTIASKGTGIPELRRKIAATASATDRSELWRLPEPVEREYAELIRLLQGQRQITPAAASFEAIELLTAPTLPPDQEDRYAPALIEHVRRNHQKLEFLGVDRSTVFVEARYAWIRSVCASAVRYTPTGGTRFTDKIDRVLTHRIGGPVIFFCIMGLMFQAIFTWAAIPMEWINNGFSWLGQQLSAIIPQGQLQDLVVRGGLAGVSAVVAFLPQILFLFLFIGFLEGSGYMSRAAFIMDRLMSRVGLHGKSFIPLLSSFACAIPGIMATRTMEHPKDRLATMLVAPLMSCSARLPVYTLLIAAFIPPVHVLGVFSLPGLTLLSMYALGLVAAVSMAWVFKKTLLRGAPPAFIMELPPYKLPSIRSTFYQMWDQSVEFLKRAGTIILGASILLWFLVSYPRLGSGTLSDQLVHSFAGRAGRAIEPVIAPLGFDWKIGIGLVGSLFQREIFISTMGTIYNIENTHVATGGMSLREQLRRDRNPVTGRPTFTILTAVCLMVYYVLAMQCLSTVAIMRRETNGWKWPLFQIAYMTALAYGATFIVYRGGIILGVGG